MEDKTTKIALIIAGSRTYNNYPEFKYLMDFLTKKYIPGNITIIEGGAKGADFLAQKYAMERQIWLSVVPANWDAYGKQAGYRRNVQMHEQLSKIPDSVHGCVCFWDGESKGTQHNFELSKQYKERLVIYKYKEQKFELFNYTNL